MFYQEETMFSSYPYAYSYTTYSMPLYNYFLPILALIVIIAGGWRCTSCLCASRTTTRV